jgi:hypothetical protein
MIMRLHRRPALGIAALPTTPHNTIDEILTESIQREESGVELYRELLALVKDKSVVLEEYATRLVGRGRTPPRNGAYVDEAGARLERVLTLGLRPYELTTATASISIMKSGPAKAGDADGGAGRGGHARNSACAHRHTSGIRRNR